MKITTKKLLLGSASPRRIFLFRELGLDFRVLTSETKEIPLPHLVAGDIAVSLAEEKAMALESKRERNELLITADTIVWHFSKMLGKPADSAEAFEMLKLLNGQKHHVYTGVCIMDGQTKKSFQVRSDVVFKKLSDEELKNYIKLYSPFDKAGSYGAQECLPDGMNPCSETEKIFLERNGLTDLLDSTISCGKSRIALIDHIEGSYFNVMGLPIVELISELEKY